MLPANELFHGDQELQRFATANPSFDLSGFDFHDKKAVADLTLPANGRSSAVLAKLRARQRVGRLAPDAESAGKLLAAGLDSAHQIARMPEHRFVREHAGLFGGDQDAARETHRRATAVKGLAQHLHANVHGLVASPHFAAMPSNPVSDSLTEYFQDMPSYQDLFGSLDYLTVRDCESIFGPAAYLLDMMRITDDYITEPNQGTIEHGYSLRERRPDLFELPLTCANTSDPVPALEIVNTVLGRRIAGCEQVNSGMVAKATTTTVTLAPDASDVDGAYTEMLIMITAGTGTGQVRTITSYTGATRTAGLSALWTVMPDTTSGYTVSRAPYTILASAPYPFNLPWNRPLAQVRDDLGVLHTDLESIYTALVAPVTGGTARGGSGTSITLAPDPDLAGKSINTMRVELIGGTGAGQVRTIASSSVEPDGSILVNVDQRWLITPNTTTQYHVTDSLAADRERIGLSVDQYGLVTQARTTDQALAPYYGYTTIDLTELSVVSVFCQRTGLTVAQLTELLTQGLSSSEQQQNVAGRFYINDTNDGLPPMAIVTDETDPNNPVTVISNLSINRLDRLNRFIRLATALGWDYASLNWAMVSIGATQLNQAALKDFAGIQRLRQTTGQDVVTLCALWADMKTIGKGNGPAPADLFDRVFNSPAMLNGQDPYTAVSAIPFDPNRALTWNPAGTTGQDGVIRARLLAALGVTDDDLTVLTDFLMGWLNLKTPISLTLTNLSWLYRLALGARLLRLPVGDYLLLLELINFRGQQYPPVAPGSVKPTVDGALTQQAKAAWLRAVPFTVSSLDYILRGERAPGFTPPYDPGGIAPFVTKLATASQSARLAPDSFGYGQITPAESERVFGSLQTAGYVTSLGILLGTTEHYRQAAAGFPLGPQSFVTSEISAAESETVFGQLLASHPPVLIAQTADAATLSQAYTPDTDLSFLFPGDADGPNKRNQVASVLLTTRQRIADAEFAFLFPVNADSFTSPQITPAESQRAFTQLTQQNPALIVADPAAGQQRPVADYDPATRTITVAPAWDTVPSCHSGYAIVADVTAGTAADGGLFTLRLAADATADDNAYTGMTITLTGGTGDGQWATIVAYDGAAQTATVAPAWAVVPDATSAYAITSVMNAGIAAGGDATHLELAGTASPTQDAYIGTTAVILPTGTLGAYYDPGTDLSFLFTSQGSGQSREITGYDGLTRTATVADDWQDQPDATTCYTITQTRTQGSAQAGTGTTIQLAADASATDGAYDGMTIALTSGSGAGQQGTVAGYDGATRTATMAAPWAVAPATGTGYTVTELITQGTARGGTANALFLDAGASDINGAYDTMTLNLVPDPTADIKRGEVTTRLTTTRQEIDHTAGVLAAAFGTQQASAAGGLAGFLDTTAGRLAALLPVAARVTDLSDYLDSLLTPIENGQVPVDLPPFIEALARALVLFDGLAMTESQINAVAELPHAFNITSTQSLVFDNVVSLSAFMGLERALEDTDEALLGYLRQPNDPAGASTPGPKTAALSALTGWPADQVWTLAGLLWPVGKGVSGYDLNTVDGLVRLGACFQLGSQTGLDVGSLLRLNGLGYLPLTDQNGAFIGANWQVYTDTASLALSAVRSSVGENAFPATNSELNSQINEASRNALLGYAIWALNQTVPSVTSPASLYEYLLIDVQTSGCDMTSYVAQAIASVQLYQQRCRLMLEPGVTDLSNIPDAWWEWMSAYRTWEANRRIFLYPENYLDPSLRSSVTPQYAELAQSLLGTDLTEASVTAAYRKYFEDFATVADLVLADSYQYTEDIPGTSTVYAQGKATAVASDGSSITLDANASTVYNRYLGMQIKITGGAGNGAVSEISHYDNDTYVASVSPAWGSNKPAAGSSYVISGPKQSSTLILIARTNTQPYTYYHRTLSSVTGWSPWLKIEVPISAEFVTPVRAFDKLFLFWAELKTVEGTTMETDDSGGTQSINLTTKSATLKFTYLGSDGTWTPAQVAVPDVPVDYQENYEIDPNLPKSLQPDTYKPYNTWWYKPYVFTVPQSQLAHPDSYPNGDQIVLLYGNIPVANPDNTPFSGIQKPSSAMPMGQYSYEMSMYEFALRYNKLTEYTSKATFYVPVLPFAMTGAGLKKGILGSALPNYPKSMGPYQVPVPALYSSSLWRHEQAGSLYLGGNGTENVIATNYTSDSLSPHLVFYNPGSADVALLGRVSGQASRTIAVKNMPAGNFLFDNGDEAFLARSSDTGILPISSLIKADSATTQYASGYYYVDAGVYTTNPSLTLTEIKTSFTRLSTVAATEFPRLLIAGGIPALLSIQAQQTPELPFSRLAPTAAVVPPTTETLDFNGAYGQYFWEVFFYTPFLVASSLTASQRFREAKTWYDYIFNPTQQPGPDQDGATRYWQFLPLRSMDIPTLTQTLTNPAQIAAYNATPFSPDAIAQLRISAYAKATVMRYISNLLDWADQLFTQDTRESIDEATNLYVLASDLLGPRPRPEGEFTQPAPASYDDIKQAYDNRTITTGIAQSVTETTLVLAADADQKNDAYDGMYVTINEGTDQEQTGYITGYDGASRTAQLEAAWPSKAAGTPTYRIYVNGIPQFLIDLENTPMAAAAGDAITGGTALAASATYTTVPFNDISGYFGVPENDMLIRYWDRVEDRLYKIRHCMTISGQTRALPLFSPQLDPAQLIRSRAAGGPTAPMAAPLNLAVPYYRFTSCMAVARTLAAATSQLGGELLAVLERKDAEALARLRTSQEQTLLNLATSIKQQQVEEVQHAGDALSASLASAQARSAYYNGLLAGGLSTGERADLVMLDRTQTAYAAATVLSGMAAISHLDPQIGAPTAMTYGGQQIGSSLAAAASASGDLAFLFNTSGQLALTKSGYDRRAAEWQLQADMAQRDIEQITAQQAANQSQLTIAERDLTIHQATITQDKAVEAFLTDKFTSEQLYQWMAARLSALYFQTYTIALDLARAAQRAYQYELDRDTTFVNFEYWDAGRHGLLAGEGLTLALNQMEKSYLDNNGRRLEIEKTISLSQLNPLALADLINTGECIIELPEKLFDDDYPGHYARKIKTLAVSIPALVGPYQNIHATLTQLTNQTITQPDVDAVNYLLGTPGATLPDPGVLRSNWWVNQQIALSTGTSDTGVLSVSAYDDRYLPFEGTGAVSTWRLSMPQENNLIDFHSVSDVVIQLVYSAVDGGAKFRRDVMSLPAMRTYQGSNYLPMAQVYSTQWYEFLHAPVGSAQQTLSFTLANPVPSHINGAALTGFYLSLQVPPGTVVKGAAKYLTLKLGSAADVQFNLSANGEYAHAFQTSPAMTDAVGPGTLSFDLAATPADLKTDSSPASLDPDKIQNVTLILFYQGERFSPPVSISLAMAPAPPAADVASRRT